MNFKDIEREILKLDSSEKNKLLRLLLNDINEREGHEFKKAIIKGISDIELGNELSLAEAKRRLGIT